MTGMHFKSLKNIFGITNRLFERDISPLFRGDVNSDGKTATTKHIYNQLRNRSMIIAPGIAHGNNIAKTRDLVKNTNEFQNILIAPNVDGLLWRADKNASHLILMAITADCPIITLVSKNGSRLVESIAMLHVGRKPIQDGIIEKAVDAMQEVEVGVKVDRKIFAFVYPGICGYHYQIGGENSNPKDLKEFQQRFPVEQYQQVYQNENRNVNLKEAILAILKEKGVLEQNIEVMKNVCSFAHPKLFSRRADDVKGHNGFGLVTP